MRDPHKESRVLRHLRIADGYLKSGNKLTKAVFRNLIEREGDLLGITEETKEKCKNKDGEIIEYLLPLRWRPACPREDFPAPFR